jgi:hypothetical protein
MKFELFLLLLLKLPFLQLLFFYSQIDAAAVDSSGVVVVVALNQQPTADNLHSRDDDNRPLGSSLVGSFLKFAGFAQQERSAPSSEYEEEEEEEEEGVKVSQVSEEQPDGSDDNEYDPLFMIKERKRRRASDNNSNNNNNELANLLMDNSSAFLLESDKFFKGSESQATDAVSSSHFMSTGLFAKLVIGFFLYSLTIWTIIGNILVCVIVATNKQLKQGGMSNILIGNLALSDLLLGLTVLPFSATLSTFKTWLFGRVLCDLWLSIDVLCSTASIWGLLVVFFLIHSFVD